MRVRALLKGKDFEAVHMLLPAVAAFIDLATGHLAGALVIQAHTTYTEFVTRLTMECVEQEASLDDLMEIKGNN